jgi:hypothetical protein
VTSDDAATGLSAYLGDHLAGAAAGLQLGRRLRDRETGTELGDLLSDLVVEIEKDRRSLEDLMERLRVTPSPVREAAALGAEVLARVRQKVPMLSAGSEASTRLESLELLSLGIEGKRLMWAALASVAVDRTDGFDLGGLEERARSQRDRLEPFRLRAAAEAAAG